MAYNTYVLQYVLICIHIYMYVKVDQMRNQIDKSELIMQRCISGATTMLVWHATFVCVVFVVFACWFAPGIGASMRRHQSYVIRKTMMTDSRNKTETQIAVRAKHVWQPIEPSLYQLPTYLPTGNESVNQSVTQSTH